MRRVGIGYRRELANWIEGRPPEIECLEITAEHFFDGGDEQLRSLAVDYPVFVHGLGLSLGTPGPLDKNVLEHFVRLVKIANPEWISEHIAFTRSSEIDLGHLNPVQPAYETLSIIADHAVEVSEQCGKPLILENITSHLRLEGEMSEPEFLNHLCEKAGCGLLLDVTNLYINSKNHNFDPCSWLHELNPQHIVQLHVVGYSVVNGQWQDLHSESIQEDLLDLVDQVLGYAPVQAIIIERDSNFPESEELAGELRKLKTVLDSYGPYSSSSTPSQ